MTFKMLKIAISMESVNTGTATRLTLAKAEGNIWYAAFHGACAYVGICNVVLLQYGFVHGSSKACGTKDQSCQLMTEKTNLHAYVYVCTI